MKYKSYMYEGEEDAANFGNSCYIINFHCNINNNGCESIENGWNKC